MKSPNKDNEYMKGVEKALKNVYHSQAHKNIEVDDVWRQGVMAHVLRLRTTQEEKNSQDTDLRLIWRFAGALSAAALLLLFYAAGADMAPQYNLAQMLIADPTSLAISQLVIP